MRDLIQQAMDAGLTEREAHVWAVVSYTAGAYISLTEDEPGHVMEREEICHAFHVIQGHLALRPFMRKLGGE